MNCADAEAGEMDCVDMAAISGGWDGRSSGQKRALAVAGRTDQGTAGAGTDGGSAVAGGIRLFGRARLRCGLGKVDDAELAVEYRNIGETETPVVQGKLVERSGSVWCSGDEGRDPGEPDWLG